MYKNKKTASVLLGGICFQRFRQEEEFFPCLPANNVAGFKLLTYEPFGSVTCTAYLRLIM